MVSHTGSSLEITPFAEVGLPDSSLDGEVVDYDGDGRMELFLVPQGIFEPAGTGNWTGTDLFAVDEAVWVTDARSVWFDAGRDGDLDLWLLLENAPVASRVLRWPLRILGSNMLDRYRRIVEWWLGPVYWYKRIWRSLLVRRTGPRTHETLRLVGAPGNREAVGAIVQIDRGDRKTNRVVGMNDGSHLSQTLYDIYVGVAEVDNNYSVTLAFPGSPPDAGHEQAHAYRLGRN